MSLLADLDAAKGSQHRSRPCEFGLWLDSLTEEERAAVRAKIGSIPDRALAAVITANGYRVSVSTIAGHRRNECVSCRF